MSGSLSNSPPILVTGAGGQLGKALSRLNLRGVLLSREELDVTNRDSVLSKVFEFYPRAIIHAAAFTKVDLAEAEPDQAAAVNVEGTRNIVDAAIRADATLVYLSTDYVFSGEKDGPYLENDPTGPRSVYGRTKLAGEELVRKVPKHFLVRTSWVFGEGQNFIRTILEISKKQEEVSVVDDQQGRPTYALDLAKALLLLLDKGEPGLYHLSGGGSPGTWADVAESALSAYGSTTKVRRISTEEFVSGRSAPTAPRPRNSVLDCSKAAELGIQLRPWPEAVHEYVRKIA